MNKKYVTLIIGIICCCIASASIIWHVVSCELRIIAWEYSAERYSSQLAILMASNDFNSGKIRIFVPTLGTKRKYLKVKEGPFERWAWPIAEDGPASAERNLAFSFAETYNAKMRQLYNESQSE